jgi:hypothetical protein
MNTLKYILSVLISLIILIVLEGLITLGDAFNFENYNWFNWFCQGIIVSIFVIIAILITHETLKD